MRKFKILAVVVLIFPLLFGCNDPSVEYPVIEDLGMVGIMGFDYVDEKHAKVTVTLSPSREEESSQMGTAIVEVPHQAVLEVSTQSDKLLSLAQLRVILFSEEYATKIGIFEMLEHLYRDPLVGSNVLIAVVKGSVEDILSQPYNNNPEINIYFNELLTPRTIVTFNPFSTVHSFINKYTDQISDPITPYLELIEDSVKITKVALFKGDKLIRAITPEEAKLIEGLKKRKKIPDMSVNYQDDKIAVLRFVNTDFKLVTNSDLENLTIHLNLNVKGSLVDYEGTMKFDKVQHQIEIEQKINEELNNNLETVIQLFQELEIDPLSLGKKVYIKNAKNWSKEEWNKAFKNANVVVDVQTTIVSPGTIR
ncbi:Ger(x)C family spore germination protein [Bacillus sp. FJAT-45066]|uniref:Ger(x)C family spore germination protein n=1 Tax=Bacillus sp. FJAT-45066 TaxID=2011010 RepID=UPI0015966C0B|nr:Ger(x)C family spore germination protein [Bacillus sp. FJAT-45066]